MGCGRRSYAELFVNTASRSRDQTGRARRTSNATGLARREPGHEFLFARDGGRLTRRQAKCRDASSMPKAGAAIRISVFARRIPTRCAHALEKQLRISHDAEQHMRVLGIMSGTSIDGVDYALVDVERNSVRLLKHWSRSFPNELQRRLHAAAANECPRARTRPIASRPRPALRTTGEATELRSGVDRTSWPNRVSQSKPARTRHAANWRAGLSRRGDVRPSRQQLSRGGHCGGRTGCAACHAVSQNCFRADEASMCA